MGSYWNELPLELRTKVIDNMNTFARVREGSAKDTESRVPRPAPGSFNYEEQLQMFERCAAHARDDRSMAEAWKTAAKMLEALS